MWVQWALALVWPLAKKVLVSLGIGFITYAGLSLIGTQVSNQVLSYWGQVPTDMFKMASLLGIPQAVGIMLGGLAARIGLVAVGRLGKLTS